ncbi:MAG: DegT/DnrJ/EryC1/StrS family aminotransferase [Salibacteraceae bacterium]
MERDSFNMNPDLLEMAITENTKAIMPVSLFGQMPNLDAIQAIADKYDIPVIEDAAQSFGATRNGLKSCGATLIGSTSFFPAKPLGCYGDGGALFTNDDDLAAAMKAIRTHGGIRRHHHTLVGTNGRFDTLQAAVILGKLPHFESEIDARATAGNRFNDLLKAVCRVPVTVEGNTHVYAQYTLRVDSEKRDNVVEDLKKEGIPVAVYYPTCFHEQPVFNYLGYHWGDFPESEKASREVFSLPMHPFLTEEEQHLIADRLTFVLEKNS